MTGMIMLFSAVIPFIDFTDNKKLKNAFAIGNCKFIFGVINEENLQKFSYNLKHQVGKYIARSTLVVLVCVSFICQRDLLQIIWIR